jgi:hypothetical protein
MKKMNFYEMCYKSIFAIAMMFITINAQAQSCVGGSPTTSGANVTISACTGTAVAILPADILISGTTSAVNLYSLGGTPITNTGAGVASYIGKIIRAEAVNGTTVVCWGYIKLEDKTAPVITCPAGVTLACADAVWANGVAGTTLLNSLGQVGELSGPSSTSQSVNLLTGLVNSVTPTLNGTLALDGIVTECSKWTQYYSDVITGTKCTGFSVTRTWWAKDGWDNTSATCTQVITILAPVAPVITNLNASALCADITPAILADILSGTGPTALRPTVTGSTACGFDLVFKSGMTLNGTCAGSYRIMRTYSLVNTCVGTTTDYTQTITVTNTAAPTVSANYDNYTRAIDGTYCWLMSGTMQMTSTKYKTVISNVTTTFNGGTTVVSPLVSSTVCSAANVRIQLSGLDNGCFPGALTYSSNDNRITISATGLITNKPGQPFMRAAGSTANPTFTVTATTVCGLTVSHTFEVNLSDNMNPNTSCKVFTTATLDENGTVRVPVSAFENGSSDNCGIERQLVRRMTVPGNLGCGVNSQLAETACWNDYVDFSCEDVGDNGGQILVILRSVDAAGNTSDCMVNVNVVDKSAPSCTNQTDINRFCSDVDLNNYKLLFKRPAAFDNCGVTLKDSTITNLAISCGAGTSTATWTFKDCAGNEASCTQRLVVSTIEGYRIKRICDEPIACSNISVVAGLPLGSDAYKTWLENKVVAEMTLLNGSGAEVNGGAIVGSNNYTTVGSGLKTCSAPVVTTEFVKFGSAQYCQIYRYRVTVIDHCNPRYNYTSQLAFQGSAAQVSIGGLVGSSCTSQYYQDDRGVVVFEYFVKISDITPPTSAPPPAVDSCIYSGCNYNYSYDLTGKDDCGTGFTGVSDPTTLTYMWSVVNLTTGVTLPITAANSTPTIRLTGLNFGDTYSICYRVTDLCAIASQQYCWTIRGRDCKKPSIVCQNANAEIMPLTGTVGGGGEIVVPVDDLILSASDNCTAIKRYLKSTGRGVLQKKNGFAANGTQLWANWVAADGVAAAQGIKFTCEDTRLVTTAAYGSNKVVDVQVWAEDLAVPANADFCVAKVTLNNNMGACGATVFIAGAARTESNAIVNNVTVFANVNGAMVTSADVASGNFSLLMAAATTNVQVRAAKNNNDDASQGVTTFDIAKVSQHVLDIAKLASPYQWIAADVDKSNEIDATDMLHMRRFILKITPSLPGGNFRFIDRAYTFRNAANPFGEDFPEVVNIATLNANTTANFVAVKLGDVNGSYSALAPRGSRTLTLLANDMNVVAGNEYTVNITSDKLDASAFQGTFSFNGATVKSVKAGSLNNMTEGNFGIFANAVTASWNGKTQEASDVMTITFVANKSGKLSDMMTVNSALTQAVANDATGNEMNVSLKFNTGKVAGGEFALYQNQPNPVANETTIGFNLPKDGQARLTITAVDGKVVKVVNGEYKAGYNTVTVNKSDLNASGVFYYRLETADHSASKKMIIIE